MLKIVSSQEMDMTKRSYVRGDFYGNSTDATPENGKFIFDQVNFALN